MKQKIKHSSSDLDIIIDCILRLVDTGITKNCKGIMKIIMHLSMLCPTTLLPGYRGEKVGNLTCFDTKTCPIRGEFDRSPYACDIIKSTDCQTPHLFLEV